MRVLEKFKTLSFTAKINDSTIPLVGGVNPVSGVNVEKSVTPISSIPNPSNTVLSVADFKMFSPLVIAGVSLVGTYPYPL